MALKLKGSTSGFVAIDAPSVAGNNTLILPENTGSAHQILANDITAGVTTFTQITVSRNGDLTVPGTISIGGTLTYEDVTSVDSVGIVTARGLSIFGNTTGLQVASGISTFQALTSTSVIIGDTDTDNALTDSDNLVIGSTSGDNGMTIVSQSGNYNGSIRFSDGANSGTDAYKGTIQYYHGDNYMRFYTDSNERLRIDSTGNVGINTTQVSISGMSRYMSVSARNVTNGGAAVELVGNRTGSDQTLGVINFVNQTSNVAQITAKYQGSTTTGSLQFITSGTEAIRISQNRNLLVGTTGDTQRLHVYNGNGGTGYKTAFINSNDSTNGTRLVIGNTGNTSNRGLGIMVGGNYAGSDKASLGWFNNDNTFATGLGSIVTITSTGEFGVNTATPVEKLGVAGNFRFVNSNGTTRRITALPSGSYSLGVSGGAAIGFTRTADGGGGSDHIIFETHYQGNSHAERMRIDKEGRLLIGTTSHTGHALSSSNNPKVQLESASSADYGRMSLIYNGNDGVGPGFWFGKSRGTSIGSNTVVVNGDQLGGFFFHAADGTDKHSRAASIVAAIDGAPGANDTPGRISFNTTIDGQAGTTEKVRIPASTWGLLVTNLGSTGSTGGYQTEGVSLRYSGDSTFVKTDAPPVTLTRKGNAGKVIDFYNATTYAGGIYVNGSGNTAIQQTSDYRLKTDVSSMTDGITKVKLLNPIYFKNNTGLDTTTTQNGFLAHEIQTVLPTLVDGEKDGDIDERGKGYQTMDYAGLTPTLTAAIKELIAKVETLESEVAALKGS